MWWVKKKFLTDAKNQEFFVVFLWVAWFLASRYSLPVASKIFWPFFRLFGFCLFETSASLSRKQKHTKKKSRHQNSAKNCVSRSRVSLFCVQASLVLREYERARKEDKGRPSPRVKRARKRRRDALFFFVVDSKEL